MKILNQAGGGVVTGIARLGLLATALLGVACGAGSPDYTETGRAEGVRMVVIGPDQLADDDELWRIADYLHGQLEVADDPLQVIFWTDESRAGRGVPLNFEQVDAEAAQINLDPRSGFRDLQRY